MALGFVDPRTQPMPTAPRPAAGTTDDREALVGLARFCRDGRLYDVEDWIRAGRPLQLAAGVETTGRRSTSALEIALATENQALLLLLLCNGYDPNLEPACPVSSAIRARQWALMELLLAWGADPTRVDPDAICTSYCTEILERFASLGLDLTADHALGSTLAEHAANKPLFGFAKRHRDKNPRIQRELNIALGHHVRERHMKGVQLSLWAGADPHARAPDLRWMEQGDDDAEEEGTTAIYETCSVGDVAILRRLHPDPACDDFDQLYRAASNGDIVEALAERALPTDVTAVIQSQLFWLQDHPFVSRRSTEVLHRLFFVGMRWTVATADGMRDIRRVLLRMGPTTFTEVMKIFATADNCAPAVLHELARTPAIRGRMQVVGFFPPSRRDPLRVHSRRAREVLTKFGVAVAVPKVVRPPSTVTVRARLGARQRLQLDRQQLFERIWTEPVETLARAWGLSGRGLAKACARARIPVPPRGYWTKVQRGHCPPRPSLPALRAGEVDEIVLYVRPTQASEPAL